MSACQSNMLLRMESALGSLLYELQVIWDEVGESDDERDRILLELEQECFEVFRRKVDQANRCRAQLKQEIADTEAELAAICSAMGERPVHIRQCDQNLQNLKAELRLILPQIEEMRKRKNDRKNQMFEILFQMQSIKNEICSSDGSSSKEPAIDESNLSMKRLEELHRELQALQKEKTTRQKMTVDHLSSLYSLCTVLSLDFKKVVNRIHPSLEEAESSKNIRDSTIEQLVTTVQQLRELKFQRMQQLQDLTTSLLELWNLMDTPVEEQQMFRKVTCKLAASEDEITEPGILSIDYINHVAAEVCRLEELKASKIKEILLKKEAELEAICRKTHLIPERDSAMETAIHATDSGEVDAAYVLDQIELKIARAKEEALSRKEILEKVDKWMAACEEESWLEKYNTDDNRYNAGRGTHLALKRAEKARALVNKLPAMTDTFASKIIAWEKEKGIEFIFDGIRLLKKLERYKVQRKEKELQRKRQRDQKKHHGQLLTEQETLYGSKPSPLKNSTAKKAPRLSYASNRKVSLVTPTPQTRLTPPPKAIPSTRPSPPPKATPSTRLTPPPKATPTTHLTPPPKANANTRTANKNEGINQNERPAASSSVQRRDLSKAGVTVKQPSSNLLKAREAERQMKRKPFCPISPATPPKSKTANFMEDMSRQHEELWQKLLTINKTPPRTMSKVGQENRTPQKTTTSVLPSTPPTVTIPMQTAITPASIQKAVVIPTLSSSKTVEEVMEYSFEEMRDRCVRSRSPLMSGRGLEL